ncbi:UNVERIFIED_CONTAM: hypothetical protein RKD50_001206 [Streptomyces canus]
MKPTAEPTCRRPGCVRPRGERRRRGGRSGRTHWCSAACFVWTARARVASRDADVEEAAELMRLAELLDARTNTREFVPGIFVEDRNAA